MIWVFLMGDNDEFVSGVPVKLFYDDISCCSRVNAGGKHGKFDHIIFGSTTFLRCSVSLDGLEDRARSFPAANNGCEQNRGNNILGMTLKMPHMMLMLV